MDQFQCNRRISILLCAALIVLGACASSVPDPLPDIEIEFLDVNVWVDYMPGMKELGYATFDITITNTGKDTLSISKVIGSIHDGHNTPPMRTFACTAEKDGQAVKSLQLLPSQSYEYRFKSVAGYMPFDTGRYPIVVGAIAFILTNGEIIRAEKTKVEVFVTQ